MDHRRFDSLARALAGGSSRRGALSALLGIAAGAGLAPDASARRRKRCRPACAAGQTCVQGACRCDDGGSVCGAECCPVGQSCQDGGCVEPPPPACIAFGQPCKAVGVPCCDGLACGSGQGGKFDVACYRPAGAPCQSTAECTYASTCTDGTCVADPLPDPLPDPTEPCLGTIPVTGDPVADGEALRAMAEDPGGPATIALCAGVYRADREIVVTRDLAIEAAANPGGEVILDGGWSGGGATDGHRVLRVDGASVRLTGLVVRNGNFPVNDLGGGGLLVYGTNAAGASLTLTRVRVTDCTTRYYGGGIAVDGDRGNAATLVVRDSEVSGCHSRNGGGGLYVFQGTATLEGATVVARNDSSSGGGFFTDTNGSVTLSGTTRVTGNTATGLRGDGAGFYNAGLPITCTGAAKVCANPTNGDAGCYWAGSASCASVCSPTC